MKLMITRNQKAEKGFFGGHKGMTFVLSYRVELTAQESELIAKYKAENEVLTRSGEDIMTISDIVRGKTEELSNVGILLNNEEVIKKACADFKVLLEVMNSFGGQEVIEY